MIKINFEIASFIHDEVFRQGFAPGLPNHTLRCIWMADAWTHAVRLHEQCPNSLGIADIEMLAYEIEPGVNVHGFRTGGVQVGTWIAPEADQVPRLMRIWMESVARGKMTPDEAYKAFEEIHPLNDGNGRTGKIIHNYLNGTLNNPVLVQDFFGHGVP